MTLAPSHPHMIALDHLRIDAFYGRYFTKLKGPDLEIIHRFLEENHQLPKIDFEMRVNRLFLDQPDTRPKQWTTIIEILSAINSRIHPLAPRADAHSISGKLLGTDQEVIFPISDYLWTTKGGMKGYRGTEGQFYLRSTDGFIDTFGTEERMKEIAEGYDQQ